MDTRQVQEALRALGWPIAADGDYGAITRQAVRDFQSGLSLGYALSVDGEAGPATHKALRHSLDLGGKCGANFTFREFKSKGNGWIRVDRRLVAALDQYRWRFGPTTIVSGYRDPAHNRKVGGKSRSRHLLGDGADIKPRNTVAQVRSLGLFTGIGYAASSGRVQHVDTRPGDPARPTTWRYAR